MNIRDFLILLNENGFTFLRKGNGSHHIYVNSNGNVFSFPYNKTVYKGIVWQFKRKYCKN